MCTSAVTHRRHTHHRELKEESVQHNQEKRQSIESHNSSEFSTSSSLPSPHMSSSSSPVKIKPLNDVKKPNKIPPAKSPRMSKAHLFEDSDNMSRAESTGSAEKAEATSQSEPSPQNLVTLVVDEEANKTKEQTVTSPTTNNSRETLGSVNSLSSICEDGYRSDTDIKTMEDVISEVVDQNQDKEIKKEEPVAPLPTSRRQLRRDQTLRWTGTRKAPVLMREFTRKNTIDQANLELASSNEELNTAEEKKENKLDPGVSLLLSLKLPKD